MHYSLSLTFPEYNIGENRLYAVIRKRVIAPNIVEMDIHAPKIAKAMKPGQFIMVMADERGERIPLTPVDWSADEGWVRVVFQEVGVSTIKLGLLNVGDRLFHVSGPHGNPTRVDRIGAIAIVAGGVAIAVARPIARAFKESGNYVVSIIGARNSKLLIYEEEIKRFSDEINISTDDGSKGARGLVSQLLEDLLQKGLRPDLIWIIGPAPMMKACSEIAKRYGIKAVASLNPIMVCGMGMCGACRVRVYNSVKFACFEGPEFDAWGVDWDELIRRLQMYREEEEWAMREFQLRRTR